MRAQAKGQVPFPTVTRYWSREGLSRLAPFEVELEVAAYLPAAGRRRAESSRADLSRIDQREVEGRFGEPLGGVRLVGVGVEQTLEFDRTASAREAGRAAPACSPAIGPAGIRD